MKPINERDFASLSERELPEWLAAQQEAQREQESIDRAKIGMAVLAVLISGMIAISAIVAYAGNGA